jgi:hypothetical protein
MTREEQIQRESEVYAWTANQFDIELAFRERAKYADRITMVKVIDWLAWNFKDFISGASRSVHSKKFATVDEMIEDFKRVMEE